jgi:hypothetical protein
VIKLIPQKINVKFLLTFCCENCQKIGDIMSYYKESQAAYKKKTKQFKVQYSLNELSEGVRLELYLQNNNLSANAYLKELIKRDLDTKGIPYPDGTSTETSGL